MAAFRIDRKFPQAEIEEALRLTAAEDPRRRVLMKVSLGHRALALRQSGVILAVSSLTMAALYATASSTPLVSADALQSWSLWTTANIVVRALLTAKVFIVRSPVDVARSLAIRFIPLIIAALAAAQWIWTIELFVGTSPSTTFITFAGLLATSVAVMSIWSTSPVAPVVYVVLTWSIFVHRLHASELLPMVALTAMVAVVALLLWACALLQVIQVRDILDRSDAEGLLLEATKQANADLCAANAALSRMRHQATRELEARSLFFNSASHDFRQRLHAMKLLANGALRARADQDREEQASLRRLVESVEDVEHYITDVLDFARLDQAAAPPERKPISLQVVFQALELAFVDAAAASGVALVFRPTKAVIESDSAMVQRILENLVSNALKSSSKRVIVAARRSADGLRLQVWDQGTGIEAERLESIFVPFHKSSTPGSGQSGAGLGMAIVKRFADRLGYAVSVRTTLGRGSVVSVTIPDDHRVQSPAARPPHSGLPDMFAGRRP